MAEFKRVKNGPHQDQVPVAPVQVQRQVHLVAPTPAPFTPRPVPTPAEFAPDRAMQRQVAQPALQAASVLQQLQVQRQAEQVTLHRQIEAVQAQLPIGAEQAALQRQLARNQPAVVPAAFQRQASGQGSGIKPSIGDWAGLYAAEMGRHTPDQAGMYPAGPVKQLQRAVVAGLAQSARSSSLPAVQRHAELGQALASIQRQPLGRSTVTWSLGQMLSGERPAIQRALEAANLALQRQEADDAQVEQLHSLQRQLAEHEAQSDQAQVMQRIRERQGSGEPLPAAVRRHMEQGLNTDLSGVRIHTDDEAHQLSKKAGATAFTSGKDVYFQRSKFDPNSQSGLELLGHELTHVKQQGEGRVGGGVDPDAGLEHDAQRTGARLASLPVPARSTRKNASKRAGSSPAGAAIQRDLDPTAPTQAPTTAPTGSAPVTTPEQRVAAFKAHVRTLALNALNANAQRLQDQKRTYAQTGAGAPAWQNLRVVAETQAQIDRRWTALTAQLQRQAGQAGMHTFNRVETMIGTGRLSESINLILDDARTEGMIGLGASAPAPTEAQLRPLAQVLGQVANLEQARDLLNNHYPALGILSKQLGQRGESGAAKLAATPNTAADNARLNAQMQPELDKVLDAIAKLRGKIDGGQLPMKHMDVLVAQALSDLHISQERRASDPQSQAVLEYLDGERRSDLFKDLALLIATLGLTIASFFTLGSTALLAVGVAGGVTGGALAARQLSSATQQAGVSRTQELGGQQLSSVSKEEAERQQVLAAVGLLLSAAPVVTSVGGMLRVGRVAQAARPAGQTAQVARQAEQVTGEAAPLAARAPTLAEKTAEIQNALRLKYGQATVNTLLNQYGGNTVQLARGLDYFGDALKLRASLQAAGNAAQLNKLLNVAQTQRLSPQQLELAITELRGVLPRLLTRSENEVESALKLWQLERRDLGHALSSHGPDLTDAQLRGRITTGQAPDGRMSPTPTSSRFSSYADMLAARDYARTEAARRAGIDLSLPPRGQSATLPPPNARGEVLLPAQKIDVRPLLGHRSIGEGFTVPPALRPVPSNQHPGGTGIMTPQGRVYPASSITPISGGVHQVQIGLKWDGSRWVVGQFFPAP